MGLSNGYVEETPKVHENNSRYEGGGCLTLLKNPKLGEGNMEKRT